MTDVSVERYGGCLALRLHSEAACVADMLAMIRHFESQHNVQIPLKPVNDWHITLATKAEARDLSGDAIQEGLRVPSRFFPVGVGGDARRGVFFVVCVWPKAQVYRWKHSLPTKDFHVSITEANNHRIDKTFAAIAADDVVTCLNALGMEALEALSRQLLWEGKNVDAQHVATRLCVRFGRETFRGWARLGDAALAATQTKLAMLCFAQAIRQSHCDAATRQHCATRMVECSATTEWGQLFQSSEMEQIPSELATNLLRPWSRSLGLLILEHTRALWGPSSLALRPRERLLTLQHETSDVFSLYKLPRFFRWVVPFHLAAMSTPTCQEDIAHLAHSVGIRHVVTLTIEEPLPSAWFDANPSIKNTFLPVENYKAPSMEQIDLFMVLCVDQVGESAPLLVHCGGGKGRAGTMVACYLVAFGFNPPMPLDEWTQPAMSSPDAIAALRALRPGSIETDEQEAAVAAYCSLLWKRRRVLPEVVEEPPVSKPIIEGESIAATDLLVLCGLPGAGKTSFRTALVHRTEAAIRDRSSRLRQWVVFSGDDLGREACERSIGGKGIHRAILDRCNGQASERKSFLANASTWSEHATAVWFDFSSILCTARAQKRSDHPTLPPGSRVRSAIAHHRKTFTPPTLSEGFKTIVHITSIAAAMELTRTLAPSLPLLKFPRTPHLINLGAATDDDIVLEEETVMASSLSDDEIVITEKMDGANMGIALDASGYNFVVQNRSHYVNSKSHVQFRKLDWFLEQHRDALRSVLLQDELFPERFILYGEWLAATHSIPYSRLQSHFYAFDLYDRVLKRFMGRQRLEQILQTTQIPVVPLLWRGHQLPSRNELLEMIERSSTAYEGRVEGVYLKWERDGVVRERAKIVRADFLAGNEHWTRGDIRFNGILPIATHGI